MDVSREMLKHAKTYHIFKCCSCLSNKGWGAGCGSWPWLPCGSGHGCWSIVQLDDGLFRYFGLFGTQFFPEWLLTIFGKCGDQWWTKMSLWSTHCVLADAHIERFLLFWEKQQRFQPDGVDTHVGIPCHWVLCHQPRRQLSSNKTNGPPFGAQLCGNLLKHIQTRV